MQFLEDVRVPCDSCEGRRYRSEVLQVRLDGLSIVDVLALGIDEAIEHFGEDARIGQRLRLAQALSERGAPDLYVLDEPTTGLHPADVRQLLDCFDEVIAAGASVLVVEHNLDVIRAADHVIDLGPEAGPGGGRVVATGTPEAVARAHTPTGAALRA
jgi:excinuclease ABC subunit A